jgi:AraC family transcriptional regulator of adaptative response / DNA-3-methyladenine glycosylase II
VGLDHDTSYRALAARDARFDGLFFVGVTTTGVYCRPICPARTPGRDRCRFFARAAEAEKAGFRACFRCRPELAPGRASVDARSRLVAAAARRIDQGFLNEASVDDLAADLGVTSRHLRRAMLAELGVAPVELAQTKRLAVAKQLLQDTSLSHAEIAFASGFSSVRRYNALFAARFGRPPTEVRRAHGAPDGEGGIALRLDYRAPLDWDALLAFLRGRAIPGVELVERDEYVRAVRLGSHMGWASIRPDAALPALRARVSASLAPVLPAVVARLRALFDLDAHPLAIAEHLGRAPALASLVAGRPGLRVPGAFDGFELAVRAILGQQVSVRAATTLSGRLVERFGEPLRGAPSRLARLFPTASTLASASPAALAAIGLPAARARTIATLARAVADERLDLTGGTSHEEVRDVLLALPGIGPWTAEYIAMRALRFPDAFPASDLALRRALGADDAKAAAARVEPARPYRAYAALHLWMSLSTGG